LDYDETIRLNAKYKPAYVNRGWCKHNCKDYAGAIKDYDEAVQLDSEDIVATCNKAFLVSTAENAAFLNPDLALMLAEVALGRDSKNPYALNAKSCALATLHDYKAAIALQESISDVDWLKDKGIDGGTHAKARIAAWESEKLWHP
jgi:tetratricopeptide (TPR) repeat protein